MYVCKYLAVVTNSTFLAKNNPLFWHFLAKIVTQKFILSLENSRLISFPEHFCSLYLTTKIWRAY